MPRKQRRLIEAWAELHKDELLADWKLAMNGEEVFTITPCHKESKIYKPITNVIPTDDYKLILSFDNTEERIFDLAPILDFGRFKELKDLNVFKKVHVSFDTVEWENGLDLDPEYLYQKSEEIKINNAR